MFEEATLGSERREERAIPRFPPSKEAINSRAASRVRNTLRYTRFHPMRLYIYSLNPTTKIDEKPMSLRC